MTSLLYDETTRGDITSQGTQTDYVTSHRATRASPGFEAAFDHLQTSRFYLRLVQNSERTKCVHFTTVQTTDVPNPLRALHRD